MLALYISLGAAAFIFLAAVFVWCNNSWLKTTRIQRTVEGVDSLKIVHLSDLHGKRFGKNNVKLIEKVAAEKPDFIAVTGDIIHIYTPKNIEVATQAVSALCEVAPVLYVSGNHEMRKIKYRQLKKQLIESGATVLDNCAVEVGKVAVVGLNCAHLKNGTLEKITPDASPKILLVHEPQYFENYCSLGYDLVLCGHAHGGQWRIPFTGIGIYSPGQGLFPKYNSGVHVKDKTAMIISRGLGNSECPLRLFNRPEMLVIEIKNSANNAK